MTDRDQVSPNLWVSPLGRLNSEAVGFNNHIANITGIVAHELETGRIATLSNTISKLTDQFSALASDASSVLPRLGRFAEIVNTPSTLLLGVCPSNT